MLLSQLKAGDKAKVLNVNDCYPKLSAIGLINGVTIKVIRFAPFGDPIEIRLRNFSLAIRKSDARLVEVEKL